MKHALILSQSYAERDPRILRQIRALQELGNYKITMVGYTPCQVEGVNDKPLFENTGFRKIGLFGKIKVFAFPLLGLNDAAYWNANNRCVRDALVGEDYDIIVANEVDTLPIAKAIKQASSTPTAIWCDLHEYYLGQYSTNWLWRISRQKHAEHLCHKYFDCADEYSTVSGGIVKLYKKETGVDCHLVTNARAFEEIPVCEAKPGSIRLVHHGIAVPGRKIELMIEAMDFLDDRFSLDLYLVRNIGSYAKQLEEMARDKPVTIHQPVPYRDIVKTIQPYDVGVFLLPPTNINYSHALPNKFFEFIQARLAIAIGPTPDMQELIDEHKLGVVSSDFTPESFAECLKNLDADQINRFKLNSDSTAKFLNAESNSNVIQKIVSKLESRLAHAPFFGPKT